MKKVDIQLTPENIKQLNFIVDLAERYGYKIKTDVDVAPNHILYTIKRKNPPPGSWDTIDVCVALDLLQDKRLKKAFTIQMWDSLNPFKIPIHDGIYQNSVVHPSNILAKETYYLNALMLLEQYLSDHQN